MNINENVNVLFEKFESFIKSQTIIGQEIKVGDVTIIPMASISFGLGAGGGTGKDANGQGGDGGGSGMFAKATPTALLVVNNGDVNLVPIRKGSSFEGLLESVPALVEKLKDIKDSEPKSEQEEE
ncbi:GerW family sporulation protein [Sphaerochaeta sp. S2]|uniref:GerW family sporulation protein n=1 Tax=Sphaerochaeta sp. S2 TaxID=2798868 RepID=UPI0018E9D149|nr:spore germination protein GerW family protein [Sphaerochaeta sp. S2]MBJ2354850.1 sporulation protein [Sphaerochaeta sp. S2]